MATKSRAEVTLTKPSDKEIVVTRDFSAPRDLVFEAWTKPEHVRRWFGLRGSTLSVCEIDLRVGGTWRWVIREHDGNELAFSGEYREVVRPERLVFTQWYEAIPGADMVVTLTFAEQNGKTTLRQHLLYKSQELRDGHLMSGMEEGMLVTFERLDEVLESMKA
jgi:uncharacterized protein YndB with AHSA1/START domain